MQKVGIGLLLMLLVASLGACERRPGMVLPPKRMARLLADIHIGESVIEGETRTFSSDSMKKAFRQSIYLRNHVTEEEADSSFRWYGYHLEKYMEVYDLTIEMLENDLALARENSGTVEGNPLRVAVEGDSVDVWTDIRTRRFSSGWPTSTVPFIMLSDHNWERGDAYTLRAKLINPMSNLNVIMVAEYNDGTRDYASTSVSNDGWMQLRLVLDSAKIARQLYGMFEYDTKSNEQTYLDSIQLVRTRFSPWNKAQRAHQQSFSNTPPKKK